ncbi:MAG: glycosyltransferase family 4 protein, partial [Rikenellaceae bacterium]
VHAQQSIDAIFAMIACVGTSIKVVQTIHGFDYGASFISRLIYMVSMLFCHATYFVSAYQKSYYLKRYNIKDSARYDVVYNGINFEKILGAKHSPIDFISEGRSKNRLQICMVGNFVRVREQNTVCRFLKLLKEKGVDYDFYFVGKRHDAEPWRYDECVEYCSQNNLLDSVHFLGGRGDVPAILQQVDAFVYSTDHDTFGIAVIEAIAAGLPTFVNDWSVMKEVTCNGKYAYIYKTKDEVDLLNKFMAYLSDKDNCDIKAQADSISVCEAYSITKHIECLYLAYAKLFKSR